MQNHIHPRIELPHQLFQNKPNLQLLKTQIQNPSEKGKDHTFIETESVRYVYHPLEHLFLLLITNKTSNILEDLETLRLLAKTVQDCCKDVQVSLKIIKWRLLV